MKPDLLDIQYINPLCGFGRWHSCRLRYPMPTRQLRSTEGSPSACQKFRYGNLMELTFLTSNRFFSPPDDSTAVPDLLALAIDFALGAAAESASGISISAISGDKRRYIISQLTVRGNLFSNSYVGRLRVLQNLLEIVVFRLAFKGSCGVTGCDSISPERKRMSHSIKTNLSLVSCV